MSRYCVLQVDDDEHDAYFLRFAWQQTRLPHLLREVQSGEEALAYLKGDGQYADRQQFPLPALILLDIKMPRVSGFEVLDWIRAQPELRGVVVVMLTASAQPEDMDRACCLGANAFVQKPARNDELQDFLLALDHFWFKHHQLPFSIAEVAALNENVENG